MEVAIGTNGVTPFQSEVREWQSIDTNTGAHLSTRLEADRWMNGPLNAYGKVVDSKNFSQPNGVQLSQRKQFEILQAQTTSGSLQVIRTQAIHTTSSRHSSRVKNMTSSKGPEILTNGFKINNNHLSSVPNQCNQLDQYKSLIGGPSLKLSTLMNGTNATNSGSKNSNRNPHLPIGGMSLVQQNQLKSNDHDQQAKVTLTDSRFQPTMKNSRVGVTIVDNENIYSKNSELSLYKCKNLDSNKKLSSNSSNLNRGRSVSIDDLTIEFNQSDNSDDSCSPKEWQRVSKIRRSFQFPKCSSPKPSSTRPVDLPTNSVSVARIRQELENGRRLNTAMRNNHVDLVALDNILNGLQETAEHKTNVKLTKMTHFLTAESLKEIRGKLKKLSDESLYKEDFITQSDIEKNKIVAKENENYDNIETPKTNCNLQESKKIFQSSLQCRPKSENGHTTSSLENRTRYRDTTSDEWHIRRKSYGFEKMIPANSTMYRTESSTDSGIGHSSELTYWTPPESTPRGTIITLNEKCYSPKTTITLMNGHDPFKTEYINDIKRHSIAVDESKYVHDTKTSVRLNTLYSKEENNSQISINDDIGRRQKRVEFCKTEVHFTAESGRVNIVETDGKPPPTQNFRRRRRTAGNSYLEAIESGVPVIHFGDNYITNKEKNEFELPKNNVTISVQTKVESDHRTTKIGLSEESEQSSNGDEISLRSILKNKPIKPKPYHLGENIKENESLWGIRLKPALNDLQNDTGKSVNLNRSVAEQVRIVEEKKSGNGYSTKINLSLTNTPDVPPNQMPGLHSTIGIIQDKHYTVKTLHSDSFAQSLKSTPLIIQTMRSSGKQEIITNNLKTDNNRKILTVENTSNSINNKNSMNNYHIQDMKIQSNLTSNDSKCSLQNLANKIPIPAPRVKVIGSASSVSHQLTQIRRMYDSIDYEHEDSLKADEEVNLYLNCSLCPIKATEKLDQNSESWSRIKAQRNTQKQLKEHSKELSTGSNIMSIELRSPSLKEIPKLESKTELQSIIHNPSSVTDLKILPRLNKDTTSKSPIRIEITKDKEPLKLVTGGTRKLRDHELSYFGIKMKQNNVKKEIKKTHTNKTDSWNLLSDKPDLLRHSPIKENLSLNVIEVPVKTSPYSRKKDLKRDQDILVEMTKDANEISQSLAKEKFHKDQLKQTSVHQTIKPLETITEKKPKISASIQTKTSKVKGYTSNRSAQENFRRSCCPNRSPSISSTESLSFSSNSCLANKKKSDSVNGRIIKRQILNNQESKGSRSNDKHQQQISSSEDLSAPPKIELSRRIRKTKPREKDSTNKKERNPVQTKTTQKIVQKSDNIHTGKPKSKPTVVAQQQINRQKMTTGSVAATSTPIKRSSCKASQKQ